MANNPVNDPANAHLPTINKPITLRAISSTFLVIGFLAITLRLSVRLRARLWGWDDVFVVLAGIATLIGSILACMMPRYGMGLHLWTLSDDLVMEYFKHVYSTNAAYIASTALIKLSILFQYLRLFDMRIKTARFITLGLALAVSLWGLIFFILALFSCRPISKNWKPSLDGKCVAFGSKDPDVFFASFASHAALNMLFDVLVFLLPIPFLKGLRMQGKTRIGLITLFVMGAAVVTVSVARMISLSVDRAGTVPVLDMTYSTPSIYIFSVLEINIAILCASVPIFWPLVTSISLNKILVVNEVEVRNESRDSHGIALADHGSNHGFIGITEMELDNDGRASKMSRMSAVTGAAKEYGGKFMNKAHHHHRSDSSNLEFAHSNTHVSEITGTRRSSNESQRKLAHQASSGNLSSTASTPTRQDCLLDPPRSLSASHYQDGYVQNWVAPGFTSDTSSNGKGGVRTTVQGAQVPYDHIDAREKCSMR